MPAASASGMSRSTFPFPMTSSIRYLEEAGRTRPAGRLISIRTRPSARRPRRAAISARVSFHAAAVSFFFFALSAAAPRPPAASPPRRAGCRASSPRHAASGRFAFPSPSDLGRPPEDERLHRAGDAGIVVDRRVSAQPRDFSSGMALPITTGVPANSSISRSLRLSPIAMTSSRRISALAAAQSAARCPSSTPARTTSTSEKSRCWYSVSATAKRPVGLLLQSREERARIGRAAIR